MKKPMLEEEARKRQIELAGTRSTDLVELIPQGEKGKSRDQAGLTTWPGEIE